jgi:hypothetical protein
MLGDHFDLVDSKTAADEGGAEVRDDIKAFDAIFHPDGG